MPALRHVRRLPLPGSRVRGAARREGAAGPRCALRLGRFADPPLEPIVPGPSPVRLPQQARVLVHAGEDGVDARLPSRRALGRGRRHRGVPAHDRSRQCDPARRARLGAGGAARAVRPGDRSRATFATSSCEKGGTRGRRSSLLVTAPGERFETGYLVDVLRRFPEVRSIHWAINDTPAERDEPADGAPVGDRRDRGGDSRAAVPRPPVRVPADEYGDGRAALRARREFAGSTGAENVFDLYCGTGTIGLALAADARGVGPRDLGGGGRLRDRERRAERHREREVLRGQRRTVARGARARRPATRRRRRRSAARGARGQGSTTDGRARRGEIVYVSCNPTTLASDVQVLRDEYGYELVRCRPVDMFPHTPHVESVSVAAGRLWLSAPAFAARRDVAPDEVGVRERGTRAQIAGRAGSPADVTHAQTRTSVTARKPVMPSHVQATRSPKRSAAARKSAKKMTSGGPMLSVAVSPGVRERDRDALEEPRAAARRRSCVGPAATDQMSTHGHERGDEGDPPELLEELKEPEAERARSTRAWRRSKRTAAGRRARGRRSRGRARAPPPGARAPARAPCQRKQRARSQRDESPADEARRITRRRRAKRELGQLRGEQRRDRAVRDERPAERARARASVARSQYGGCSAHQGPSALKAFQKRVFAACSSSDSSMSGVTSASIVGVNRWISPPRSGRAGRRAGSGARSGTRRARSPIATMSFGWTMCSSRVEPCRCVGRRPPSRT